MDTTLWCGSCINHVKLINSVYPKEPGEEGPNNSNLEQLLFYADTKSHKLLKIGAYLHKKLLLDLKRQRMGFVRVTQTITLRLVEQFFLSLHFGVSIFLPKILANSSVFRSLLRFLVSTSTILLWIQSSSVFTPRQSTLSATSQPSPLQATPTYSNSIWPVSLQF
ncbi:hypothetical protein HK096_001707 [Nowakowskiella sp. JEL0078]|nr:hypothetical protein HK096_001707 [Nowakowskiella sp. JEL0078]